MENHQVTSHLQKLPRDLTELIKDLVGPKLWLWTYCPDPSIDWQYRKKLIIEADTREEAIWKLKQAAEPLIGRRYDRFYMTGYGLHHLFHSDIFDGNFSCFNMRDVKKEEFIKAFEEVIKDDRGHGDGVEYKLESIDTIERI